MRRSFALLLLACLGAAPAATADLGPLEPLADFHRAVHESLGLPEPLIVRLLERGLPEPELTVVGRLAAHVDATPERIAELRLDGLSWLDITLRFGAGPELYYVDFGRDPGPPYGNAWGHYKKTPRSEWRSIRLSDAEIVDLANVQLMVSRYGLPPSEVVELRRSGGRGYAELHREIVARRGQGPPSDVPGKGPKKAKGKPKKPPL